MNDPQKLLIVEDDETLRVALQDNLVSEGYLVKAVEDFGRAKDLLEREVFDLILLDIMLPDGNGYDLARRTRELHEKTMILMLTARSLEPDIVQGFEAGADDYIVKPYRLSELLARTRALLRRSSPTSKSSRIRFSTFTLDVDSRQVVGKNGKPIEFTRTEFDLLYYFLRNRNRALTRQNILDKVWGPDVVVDGRTVDNFVSNIKKKLGWSPRSPFTIRTIRGVGYRFEIEE